LARPAQRLSQCFRFYTILVHQEEQEERQVEKKSNQAAVFQIANFLVAHFALIWLQEL